MFFENNLNCLRRKDKRLYDLIRNYPLDRSRFEVLSSKNGYPVLKVKKDQKEITLASLYDPLREANNLTREVDLEEIQVVWALGFGLGYHLRELSRKLRNNQELYIIEVEIDLFKIILELIDLKYLIENHNVKFIISKSLDEIYAQIHNVEILSRKAVILKHPPSLKLGGSIYNCLEKLLNNTTIYEKRKNLTPLTLSEITRLFAESILIKNWPKKLSNRLVLKNTKKDIKKVLLIQLSSIGDVMYTTPVFKAFEEKYPNSKLSFLTEDTNIDLVKNNPHIKRIFSFPKKFFLEVIIDDNNLLDKFKSEVDKFIAPLVDEKFDLVINLHTSHRSAFLNKLIKGKESWGITIDECGYSLIEGPSWINYKFWISVNPKNAQLSVLKPFEEHLRMSNLSPKRRRLEIYFDERVKDKCKETLMNCNIVRENFVVGLNIGSNFPSRQWREDYFAEIGDRLIKEFNCKVLLFGGYKEKERANNIIDIMQSNPVDLVGKTTLLELAGFIKRCNLLITADTGALHIATALSTNSIVITGPAWVGPGGPGNLILSPLISCSGCKKTICKDHKCMKIINPEAVLESVEIISLLNKNKENEAIKLVYALQKKEVKVLFSGNKDLSKLFNYTPLIKDRHNGDCIAEKILNYVYLNFWEILRSIGGGEIDLFLPKEIIEDIVNGYNLEDIKKSKDKLEEYIQELQKVKNCGKIDKSTLKQYFEFLEVVDCEPKDAFLKNDIRNITCENMIKDMQEIIKRINLLT
ncbi:MAG: glycosyltransferase family 9 protein [bacterium]|nr:glycosyltransferase family 9 protein [bacterium]